MAYVIFGGAGFVGQHLAKSLASDGYKVVICDIKKGRISGANVSSPTGELATWYNPIEYKRVDVTNFDDVYFAVDKGDIVINLAAIAQFAQAELFPEMSVPINAGGTSNVVAACQRNYATQLIQASTGSVYSTKSNVPIDETQPVCPGSMYGLSKLWSEQIVSYYAPKAKYISTILRFPHIVGPGKFWGANTFIKMLLDNEQPIIFGDGEAKNDFTYVDDIVQAVKLSIKYSSPGIYNIGTGTARSTIDFFKWCRIATERQNIEPKYLPPRPVDFPVFEYDISKARDTFGYYPKYTMEQAIDKTVKEWYQWT